MNIVYCINSISHIGGIARVTVAKANALAAIPGNKVWIAYTDVDPSHPEPALPLDPRVGTIDLGVRYYADDFKGFFYRVRSDMRRGQHRRLLEQALNDLQPDIVVSVGQSEKYFLPKMRLKKRPAYVREFHYHRNYRHEHVSGLPRRLMAWLNDFYDFELQLPHYDAVCVLTDEDYEHNWQHSRVGGKVRVIPNPLTEISSARACYHAHTVVTVGRVTWQKNHSSLVRAWQLVAPAHPDWRLVIYGDGDLMDRLREQVAEAGLGDSISLRGEVSGVSERLAECSIFVLTSRFEGFGLALTEAANVGLPLVSYACPCGPRDIINDGIDGLLVNLDDEQGLADALEKLMRDEALRKQMGEAALAASRRYNPATIAGRWMDLFNELTGH